MEEFSNCFFSILSLDVECTRRLRHGLNREVWKVTHGSNKNKLLREEIFPENHKNGSTSNKVEATTGTSISRMTIKSPLLLL